METTEIVLCNGIDDSLQDLELSPFEYGFISPYVKEPIEKRCMYYTYNDVGDSNGIITNITKETITVDTLYDLFHHLFAPDSMVRRFYCEDGPGYPHHQEFRFFRITTELRDNEEECLIDAIRLFKTSRAGLGIKFLPDGVAVDDMYRCETNCSLRSYLPSFTLNDAEKKEFVKFFAEFHDWYTRFYKCN